MSAAAPACPTFRARRGRLPHQHLDDGVDFLPRHLVIVGGSYIGLEFAQMYRRFGAEVTVIETRPAADRARGRGRLGAIRTSSRTKASPSPRRRVHRLCPRGADIAVVDHAPAGRRSSARMCCWRSAGGRTPTISAWTRRASRPTGAATSTSTTSCATNVPGIWAMGDCNGKGAFTHTVLQRLRDRRGQPARRRPAPRQRPHHDLRALHRSAARPRRA